MLLVQLWPYRLRDGPVDLELQVAGGVLHGQTRLGVSQTHILYEVDQHYLRWVLPKQFAAIFGLLQERN